MTIMAGLHEEHRYRSIYCEQCGDVYAVMASSSEAARDIAPLRTCTGCALLACMSCWPVGARHCSACRAIEGARWTPTVGNTAGTMEYLPVEPPDSIAANVVDQPATFRRPIVAAAVVAQTVAVLLVAMSAGGLLPAASPPADFAAVAPPTTTPLEAPAAAAEDTAAAPLPPASNRERPASTVATHEAALETTAEQLVVTEDPLGVVRLQVIATARNRSGAPIVVAASDSAWAVIDELGAEVARGRFEHAFPPVVPPGGMVLYVEDLTTSFARPAELSSVHVELAAEGVAAEPTHRSPAGPSAP
jgi:hypothetical protein